MQAKPIVGALKVLCFTTPPEIYVLLFCAGQKQPLLYRVDSEQIVDMKTSSSSTSILRGPVVGKELAQVVDVRHDEGFTYAALEQERDGRFVVSLWSYSGAGPQPY